MFHNGINLLFEFIGLFKQRYGTYRYRGTSDVGGGNEAVPSDSGMYHSGGEFRLKRRSSHDWVWGWLHVLVFVFMFMFEFKFVFVVFMFLRKEGMMLLLLASF